MVRKYFKPLMMIAVPIMLSNVISQLQMIIDRIFLGQMNPLYMSALGNVNSPMWTTMSFCFSLTTGASILISQNVGSNNKKDIEKYGAALIKWNNIIPIVLFFFWMFCGEHVFRLMGASENLMPMCLSYSRFYAPVFLIVGFQSSFVVIMQTSNYTKPLLYYGIVRAGLNIILDWIFIFGRFGLPEMGIKGAAIATTISEYTGVIFSFIIVIKSCSLKTMPSFKAILKARIMPFLRSIKLGVNTAMEDIAWNLGNLVMIRILNTINEMAAGIYSIVFSIELVVVVIIGAIGNGTLTLSGEAKGKNDVKQLKGVCVTAYLLSAAVAFVMLIICILIPDKILSLFANDKGIIESCGIYLVLVCINFYGKAANIVIGNGIRGSGNTKWMLGTQILGTVMVICFACLFVFVFNWGIAGVFMAVIVDELIRAFINLLKLRRITNLWEKSLMEKQ